MHVEGRQHCNLPFAAGRSLLEARPSVFRASPDQWLGQREPFGTLCRITCGGARLNPSARSDTARALVAASYDGLCERETVDERRMR